MINLETFIEECERTLLLKRDLSEDVLLLIHRLSNRHKILCKPIIEFITREAIAIEIDAIEVDFLPEERILVCRLLPLTMRLDTSNPGWSSYMLTLAIQAATSINGLKLSEIGIAILDIFCKFKTPLNKFVYNFCIDLSREFTVNYRERLDELSVLSSWAHPCSESTASAAFLRKSLSHNNEPEFILKTMVALLQNEYFEDLISSNKYLFENLEYKQTFLEYLYTAKLSKTNEHLILSAITSE